MSLIFGFFRSDRGSIFRRNFIKVAKANVIIQILPLAASPILTRLYNPSDFGVFALFSANLALLSAFSTWRFDWSIPSASSRSAASALFYVGFIILIFFSIFLSVIFFFFEDQIVILKEFEVLDRVLWLLPIALFANGLQALLQGWYIYEEDLSDVAQVKVTQGMSSVGINIFGGVFGYGALGLVVAGVASSWLGAVLLLKKAKKMTFARKKLRLKRLWVVLLRSWRESSVSTFVSIISAANIAAIPFLLAYFFSSIEVGWYALMYRVVMSPISILGTAISQSFWAEAKSLISKDMPRLQRLYLRATKHLIILSIPVMIICITGPLYIGLLFGEDNWAEAGYILAALTPSVAGSLIVQPLTHLIVHKKQQWKLYLDSAKLILMITTVFILGTIGVSIHIVVLYLSIIALFSYAILFYLNFICLKK